MTNTTYLNCIKTKGFFKVDVALCRLRACMALEDGEAGPVCNTQKLGKSKALRASIYSAKTSRTKRKEG